MATPTFGTQQPILKIYDTDGVTTLKTLYLPVFEAGDIRLTWLNLGKIKTRIDGTNVLVYSDANKKYLPKLSITFKFYLDEQQENTYTIGTSNNNTPTFEGLLTQLATYSDRLAISPGNGSYFNCILKTDIESIPFKNLFYQNIELEFVSKVAYSTMSL